MAEGAERLVMLLAPFRKHDHEGPGAVGHPRHRDSDVGVDALMHEPHARVPGVERDTVSEIADTQCHVGEPEIGHFDFLLGVLLGSSLLLPCRTCVYLSAAAAPIGLHSARRAE